MEEHVRKKALNLSEELNGGKSSDESWGKGKSFVQAHNHFLDFRLEKLVQKVKLAEKTEKPEHKTQIEKEKGKSIVGTHSYSIDFRLERLCHKDNIGAPFFEQGL